MTAAVHGAQVFLLAWLLFLVAGSLAAALVVRAARRRVGALEPRVRHRALVLLAALPILIAGVIMVSAILPALLSLERPGLDHCQSHGESHIHLCFVHLPRSGMSLGFVLLLVVVVGTTAGRLVQTAIKLTRALRVVRALARSGVHRDDLGVTVIETDRAVCLTAGLFRPRVLLARWLLEALSGDEREVVVAHEHAHQRRRDALVAGIVRVLTTAHLPAVARWINHELDVAAEQACDDVASRIVGDRLAVASTILTVERASRRAPIIALDTVAVGFGQTAAARRVEALLDEPVAPRSLAALLLIMPVAVLAVVAASRELHHVVESFLSFLAY